MFPRRKFYRFFVSVVILLLICALVQFLSVNLIGFSSNNSLNRKTTPEERIRGVREKDRSLYISEHSNTFKCKDDSAVIRLNQVNDDYCDCESDGSDEPGTEACPNGKFFCLPEERYMPSSRVNDGICDCCDGSDEWRRANEPSDMGNEDTRSCVDDCKGIHESVEKRKRLVREGTLLKEEYLDAGRPYIGFKNGLYGAKGEYYLLSQECFYHKKEKIRYTVCPYKESMQESEGKSFLIGEGGSWMTDPVTGDDILVMNGGERSRCPQGKKRRTMIYFVCGITNEILSLTEDEVCVYAFHLSTPAAC